MTSPDRRLAPRIAVQIAATAHLFGGPAARFDPEYQTDAVRERTFDATIVDLSVTGAGLLSSLAPALMSRLSLRFDLPGCAGVIAACVVIWRRPPMGARASDDQAAFGVRFEALDLSARQAIHAIASKS
jgi:hypothetical protein